MMIIKNRDGGWPVPQRLLSRGKKTFLSDSAELHRICRDLGGRPHDWGTRAITAKYARKMSRSSAVGSLQLQIATKGKSRRRGRTLRWKQKGKKNKLRTGPACQSLVVTLPSDWRISPEENQEGLKRSDSKQPRWGDLQLWQSHSLHKSNLNRQSFFIGLAAGMTPRS